MMFNMYAYTCMLLMIASSAVKSEETGYNPYNPRSQNAYTKPETDPRNYDDVMKTTTPGSSSQRAAYAAASNCFKTGGGKVPEYYICRGMGDYKGHRQHKFCQTDTAQHCIDDLRFNKSRNVHSNCSYTAKKVYCNASENYALDDGENIDDYQGSCWTKSIKKSGMQLLGVVKHDETWGACCPILDGTKEEFTSSSAYPDALLCLKRAYCDTSKFYADLKAECEERCCADGECDRDADDDQYNIYSSTLYTDGGPCSPTTISSAHQNQPLLVLLMAVTVSALIALM